MIHMDGIKYSTLLIVIYDINFMQCWKAYSHITSGNVRTIIGIYYFDNVMYLCNDFVLLVR